MSRGDNNCLESNEYNGEKKIGIQNRKGIQGLIERTLCRSQRSLGPHPLPLHKQPQLSITASLARLAMPPARTRSKKVTKSKENLQQSTPSFQDGSSDEFNGVESDDPMEKDENELELERMVFGDEAGFYTDLKSHKTCAGVIGINNIEKTVGNGEKTNGDEKVLEDVTDAEVECCLAGSMNSQADVHEAVLSRC